jgi:hypothetical protein
MSSTSARALSSRRAIPASCGAGGKLQRHLAKGIYLPILGSACCIELANLRHGLRERVLVSMRVKGSNTPWACSMHEPLLRM